jgi:hypothetical protein
VSSARLIAALLIIYTDEAGTTVSEPVSVVAVLIVNPDVCIRCQARHGQTYWQIRGRLGISGEQILFSISNLLISFSLRRGGVPPFPPIDRAFRRVRPSRMTAACIRPQGDTPAGELHIRLPCRSFFGDERPRPS